MADSTATTELQMLSMADLQKVLKASRRTVQAWRATGFLPAADLVHGKTVRWRATTIDRWLNSGAATAI